MDFVLRRFWMVDLAFLAGAALLCALTFGIVATSPLPRLVESAMAAVPVKVAHASTPLSTEAVSQVLGIPVSGTQAELPAPVPSARAPLAVRLLGTSVSTAPEFSLANIEDLVKHEAGVFGVGDALQETTVVSIDRLRVVVAHPQGELETIELGRSVAGTPPLPPAASAVPSPRLPTRADDGAFQLTAEELQDLVRKVPAEFAKMAWVPSFSNGAMSGWKVARLAPDALLARYGFAAGDVVRRVNGFEVNDPSKLMEVLTRLSGTSRIDVELDRNGAGQRLSYRVR